MSTNTMYEMMRKSELMDDDGMDMEEADDCEQQSDAGKIQETIQGVLHRHKNQHQGRLVKICLIDAFDRFVFKTHRSFLLETVSTSILKNQTKSVSA